jgi:hypothetical protein
MTQNDCVLASETGEHPLVQKNQELRVLYRAHKRYHEVASPNQAESSAVNPPSTDAEKFVPTGP